MKCEHCGHTWHGLPCQAKVLRRGLGVGYEVCDCPSQWKDPEREEAPSP